MGPKEIGVIVLIIVGIIILAIIGERDARNGASAKDDFSDWRTRQNSDSDADDEEDEEDEDDEDKDLGYGQYDTDLRTQFIIIAEHSNHDIIYNAFTKVMYSISTDYYGEGVMTLLVNADGTPMLYSSDKPIV